MSYPASLHRFPRELASRTVRFSIGAFLSMAALVQSVDAQTLSKEQIACATALQRAGGRVARIQIHRFLRCADAFADGRLPAGQSVPECVASDPSGRLERARAQTIAAAERHCTVPPPFGANDAQVVNDAYAAALRTAELFGSHLERSLASVESDRARARCQQVAAEGIAELTRARLTAFEACMGDLLRIDSSPAVEELRGCLDADPGDRVLRTTRTAEDRTARACRGVDLSSAFPSGCGGDTIGEILDCASAEARCGTCLALNRAANLGAGCQSIAGVAPATVCRAPSADAHSVARQWDEEMLGAIRVDFPRPPIHARNLFHLSAAMWDAWAAYDSTATQIRHQERRNSIDPERDRERSISFAAYRLLRHRFANSPNAVLSRQAFDARMAALGLDPSYSNLTDDTAAALGNRIAATIIATGLVDGSNEAINYADPTYQPVNEPLVVKLSGASMIDPNRWQPLALDVQIGQNGIPIPGRIQVFVGPQWGDVVPFALERSSPTDAYLDPGPPPFLGGVGDALFKTRILDMLRDTSHLTIDDGATIDISPASWGNNPLGTNDGQGYTVNPVTGAPYAPEVVKRGDFARVLAEFWADGPSSETPPGHWNSLANYVSDHPLLERRLGGAGEILDPLEWDVKLYLALNGGLHDAAIQCWGLKRRYDYVRPISMIRFMGGRGQSSDPSGPSYDPLGLPLEPGLVEVITAESSAPGERHAHLAAHVGQIAVNSWPGQPSDPLTQYSGIRWHRAVEWVPYQRNTFVTPPFAAFSSGHSTYSRTAAEVLTRFTGSSYFPGGLGEYAVRAGNFLQFEIGPSEEFHLQWAQYYDAADQAGLSRLYGGIHVGTDDFGGRISGAEIGILAHEKALTYFAGAGS
jgi:hypothetical protein